MNYFVSLGIACCVSAISAQSLEPHVLSELNVRTYALPPSGLPDQASLHTLHSELGSALSTLPGVALRTQGRHGGEPVAVLGYGRWLTCRNGLHRLARPVPRMDPPADFVCRPPNRTVSVKFGLCWSMALSPLAAEFKTSQPGTFMEQPRPKRRK